MIELALTNIVNSNGAAQLCCNSSAIVHFRTGEEYEILKNLNYIEMIERGILDSKC